MPDTGQVSFQFPLNDNPSHPYCSGVDEILIHYRAQLQAVELYGPTNFAPVINNTISIAKQYQDGKHYFVLLILTDGENLHCFFSFVYLLSVDPFLILNYLLSIFPRISISSVDRRNIGYAFDKMCHY